MPNKIKAMPAFTVTTAVVDTPNVHAACVSIPAAAPSPDTKSAWIRLLINAIIATIKPIAATANPKERKLDFPRMSAVSEGMINVPACTTIATSSSLRISLAQGELCRTRTFSFPLRPLKFRHCRIVHYTSAP